MLARSLPAVAALCLAGALLPGCAARVYTDVPPPPSVTVTAGFEPLYYRGHVVYFDTIGRPLYYIDGRRYYVPPSYRYYDRYRRYYRSNYDGYRRWERRHAPRYHRRYYDRRPRYDRRRDRGPRYRDVERRHRR